jgi:hypothetical protein
MEGDLRLLYGKRIPAKVKREGGKGARRALAASAQMQRTRNTKKGKRAEDTEPSLVCAYIRMLE